MPLLREALFRPIPFVISQEREIVLERISKEREVVLADVRRSFAAERQTIADSMSDLGRRLVSQAIVGAAAITGGALVVVFFGIIALMMIFRRLFSAQPHARAWSARPSN